MSLSISHSDAADTYLFLLQIIRSFPPASSGILYCMTKKETENLSDYLRDNNISADYYHAGMTKHTKQAVQAAWLEGKIHVVCATIAYGREEEIFCFFYFLLIIIL